MKYLIILCLLGSIFATSSCKKSSDSTVAASYQLLDTGSYTVTSGSITINSLTTTTYSPANSYIFAYVKVVNNVKAFSLSVNPNNPASGQLAFWDLSLTNPAVSSNAAFQSTEYYVGNGSAYTSSGGSIVITDYNGSSPGVLLNGSISSTVSPISGTPNKETVTINLQLTKK